MKNAYSRYGIISHSGEKFGFDSHYDYDQSKYKFI